MVLKTTPGMQERQRDGVHFQLMDYGAQNDSSEEITKSLSYRQDIFRNRRELSSYNEKLTNSLNPIII